MMIMIAPNYHTHQKQGVQVSRPLRNLKTVTTNAIGLHRERGYVRRP